MRYLVLGLLAAAAAAAAVSSAAGPSPDGVIIFERRTGTGVADLYAVHPNGTGLRRITRTQNNFDPALSPDGRRIAFASHRGRGAGATDLYVIGIDGRGLRRLTRNAVTARAFTIDHNPAWSPDGRTVAFVRTFVRGAASSTDVFTVPARGGAVTRVTTKAGREASPAYRPDGSLGYARGGAIHLRIGTTEFFVRDGGEPAWAPDRTYLVYSRDGAVYTTLGQGERRVADGSEPTWSPDAKAIAVATPTGIAIGGRVVTRPPRLAHDVSPSWGPVPR